MPVLKSKKELQTPQTDDFTLKSLLSRAYRYAEINRLREKLVSTLQKRNQKTLQVSSPHDDSGNTLLVSVLGYSTAFFDSIRVLLVDMNMRRPQLHLPFGLKQEKGFSDIASETMTWQEAVKDTGLAELKIITAGKPDEQLSFFLNRPFIKKIIHEAKEAYDLVIFDTSPVLIQNRNNVDPVHLSLLSDMVILIIQDQITSKSDMEAAVAAITKGGGNIYGIVNNHQFQKKISSLLKTI